MIAAKGLGLLGRFAGLDFNLRAGERWVLWGGSGAGKTSLARVLAGLDKPTSGKITFADNLDPPLPLLFQDPDAQMGAATVRDEIALGARRCDEPRISRLRPGPAGRRVADLLDAFDLASLSGRNPHSLSSGQKRRLNLAALSAMDPPLLILDEPELYLDDQSWKELTALLDGSAAAAGRATLEITRRPERVESADGLLVLHEGRVMGCGPPREVYDSLRKCDLPLPPVPAWEKADPAQPERPPDCGDTEILAADGLSLRTPSGQTLLDGLGFSLRDGERILILGGNAEGKTSLLLILADLADADSGLVTTDAGLRRGLALQEPERACFAPTVEEELSFGPQRFGLPTDKKRQADLLAALGLSPDLFLGRDPFTLSAGELRRVALASVLALEPGLLLLDEPTAALDPHGCAHLRHALESCDAGIIWADCHFPDRFDGFFHRTLRLANGRLKEVGFDDKS